MQRRKIINEKQKVTTQDFLDFGLFPQDTFDDIGSGLLIPDAAYWGFATVNQGTNLIVGSGHLISNGITYYNKDEGGTTFDLLPKLPVVTRKYVTLTTWGQEVDAASQPRTFLIDATTRATEAEVTSTEKLRRAELSLVSGVEEPDPTPPAITSNALAVAHILLDTSGVVSIEMVEENRAPNLRTLEIMAKAFDAWRIRIGALIETLASDLAALAGRIGGLAERRLVLGAIEQIAQMKDRVGLPDDYSAWAADHFLSYDNSDTEHVDFHALVEEGVRFPYFEQRDAQLGLQNPLDPNVSVTNYFMIPAYDLVERVSNVGKDGEISISSIDYQTVTPVLMSRTRTRIRYGPIFEKCTNADWWEAGHLDKAAGIFRRGNEVFQVVAIKGDRIGHQSVRLRQFWVDAWTEYYWENLIQNFSFPGSVIGETWLNSQEGYLCAVDLYFTRKAEAGDVHVIVCETTDSGQPNLDMAVAITTITPDDIKIYPNKTRVLVDPTACKTGKRYAVVAVSAGNHYLAYVSGNKFTSGSMFTSTDGQWFQGDLLNDLAIQLVFARFKSPRVEVLMQPIQLSGGIAGIDINADSAIPQGDGFALIHEVQDPVSGDWYPLDGAQPNQLNGLPSMLAYRLVFLGTTEMMPGIGVGSNSRLYTWRPGSEFTHISEERTMPGTTEINTVYVNLRLEAWRGDVADGGHHTCVPTLLYGATFESIQTGSWQDEPAQDDPDSAVYRRAVFTFAQPQHAYKIKLVGGVNDSVTACFHVAERVDIALTLP